jgi:hypothetical protein
LGIIFEKWACNDIFAIQDDFISVIVLFIIDIYMRAGRKIAQTGLTSSCSLDRTDYIYRAGCL